MAEGPPFRESEQGEVLKSGMGHSYCACVQLFLFFTVAPPTGPELEIIVEETLTVKEVGACGCAGVRAGVRVCVF